MTPKNLQTIVLTVVLLTGCSVLSNNDYKLTVVFDNANGLTTDSQVKLNGVSIGKVLSVKLRSDNKVIAILSLDKEQELPSDSRVYLIQNLLGDATIEIKPGFDIEMLADGQEIEGQGQKIEFDKEVNLDNAMDLVGELLDPNRKTTQDSILLELRLLNRNIEKLLQKK